MNFVEKNGGPHLHIKMQEKLDLLLNCRGPFTDVLYEANKWKFLFKYRKKSDQQQKRTDSGRMDSGRMDSFQRRRFFFASRHVTNDSLFIIFINPFKIPHESKIDAIDMQMRPSGLGNKLTIKLIRKYRIIMQMTLGV